MTTLCGITRFVAPRALCNVGEAKDLEKENRTRVVWYCVVGSGVEEWLSHGRGKGNKDGNILLFPPTS
jgi:hypothetical protein